MSLPTRPLCCFRHYWLWHILITRLSFWFGVHGSVLSWFKSYDTTRVAILSYCIVWLEPEVMSYTGGGMWSRCFRVKCETDLSSWHTSSCGVPQGSVFGPLVFVMYTTPLSTLVSSCTLNNHLYADDTRALSSLPSDSLRLLHNALNRISSWMTAYLLKLNSSI